MTHPIYLFRHGETVWNAERRAQGYLDSPLTPLGEAQARAMGERLAAELRDVGHAPSTVVVRASPLGRVRRAQKFLAQLKPLIANIQGTTAAVDAAAAPSVEPGTPAPGP